VIGKSLSTQQRITTMYTVAVTRKPASDPDYKNVMFTFLKLAQTLMRCVVGRTSSPLDTKSGTPRRKEQFSMELRSYDTKFNDRFCPQSVAIVVAALHAIRHNGHE